MHQDYTKKAKHEDVVVIPDIIIHHRRTSNNLLAIEVKTSDNRELIEFDKEKLKAYREYEPLDYQYALFIRFQKLDDTGKFIVEMEYI